MEQPVVTDWTVCPDCAGKGSIASEYGQLVGIHAPQRCDMCGGSGRLNCWTLLQKWVTWASYPWQSSLGETEKLDLLVRSEAALRSVALPDEPAIPPTNRESTSW